MIVYIDYIFLENLFCNYIILTQTEILLKKKASKKNKILSAVISSIYVCVMIVYSLKLLDTFILKILLGITIVYVTFRPKTIREYVKEAGIFFITSVVNVGACTIIFETIFKLSVKNELIKLIMYAISFIITHVINKYTWKMYKYALKENNLLYDTMLYLDGKEFKYTGFLDTGNSAYSFGLNVPIIFAEYISEGQKKIVKEILKCDEKFFEFNISSINKFTKTNVIKAICKINAKEFKVGVVFTDYSLSKYDKYNLILNINIFEDVIGGIYI